MRGMPRFVVQLHDATTLHFDLRLELDGVLRSWAVPKGPSLDPGVRRLALPVPDHSMAAGEFEGVHAGSTRGSGAVIVWDEGDFDLRPRGSGAPGRRAARPQADGRLRADPDR